MLSLKAKHPATAAQILRCAQNAILHLMSNRAVVRYEAGQIVGITILNASKRATQ